MTDTVIDILVLKEDKNEEAFSHQEIHTKSPDVCKEKRIEHTNYATLDVLHDILALCSHITSFNGLPLFMRYTLSVDASSTLPASYLDCQYVC